MVKNAYLLAALTADCQLVAYSAMFNCSDLERGIREIGRGNLDHFSCLLSPFPSPSKIPLCLSISSKPCPQVPPICVNSLDLVYTFKYIIPLLCIPTFEWNPIYMALHCRVYENIILQCITRFSSVL